MGSNYNIIRILVAGDSELILKGLVTVLGNLDNMEVVGEATSFKELFTLAQELQPDIIITESALQDCNGTEIICNMALKDAAHIIVYDDNFDGNNLALLKDMGVKGLVQKCTRPSILIQCILAVYNGGTYFCGVSSACLLQYMLQLPSGSRRKVRPLFNSTELEVMQMTCSQHTTKEIAGLTCRSIHTVESAKKSLLAKTLSKNSCGIMHYAIKNHLFKIWGLLLSMLNGDSLVAESWELIADSI